MNFTKKLTATRKDSARKVGEESLLPGLKQKVKLTRITQPHSKLLQVVFSGGFFAFKLACGV